MKPEAWFVFILIRHRLPTQVQEGGSPGSRRNPQLNTLITSTRIAMTENNNPKMNDKALDVHIFFLVG